jgi:hypothetical protein
MLRSTTTSDSPAADKACFRVPQLLDSGRALAALHMECLVAIPSLVIGLVDSQNERLAEADSMIAHHDLALEGIQGFINILAKTTRHNYTESRISNNQDQPINYHHA